MKTVLTAICALWVPATTLADTPCPVGNPFLPAKVSQEVNLWGYRLQTCAKRVPDPENHTANNQLLMIFPSPANEELEVLSAEEDSLLVDASSAERPIRRILEANPDGKTYRIGQREYYLRGTTELTEPGLTTLLSTDHSVIVTLSTDLNSDNGKPAFVNLHVRYAKDGLAWKSFLGLRKNQMTHIFDLIMIDAILRDIDRIRDWAVLARP